MCVYIYKMYKYIQNTWYLIGPSKRIQSSVLGTTGEELT